VPNFGNIVSELHVCNFGISMPYVFVCTMLKQDHTAVHIFVGGPSIGGIVTGSCADFLRDVRSEEASGESVHSAVGVS
jgi:hypothetical protein